MKNKILTLGLLLFCQVAMAQNFKADSVAIRAVLVDFFEVFTNPDMKHFDSNCAPAFELLENGEIWRKKEIENYVTFMLSKEKTWVRTNTFEFSQCTIKGNFAWVNYFNTATITNAKDSSIKKIKWLESIILEKTNGKWLLLQMHSTPIKIKS